MIALYSSSLLLLSLVVILTLFALVNSKEYRFEPFELYNRRIDFNRQYIKTYKDSMIDIEYKDRLICIANKDIRVNDTIMQFEDKDVISSSHLFPLKSRIRDILTDADYLNNNITKKILLSFHLMFELKSNMTLAFITLGRINKFNNNANSTIYLNEFRDYLRKRKDNTIIVNYIHNLPLSNRLSHTTWSSELLDEYYLSGSISPSTEKLKSFYKAFIYQINNDTILSRVYSHWLNDNEVNYFLSIYSYVSSKAMFIKGEYYLMPFIDVCSHYHPNQSDENNKPYKGINGVSVNSGNSTQYQIKAQGEYSKGTEFSYTYTDDLSNDNLLLNYGLTIVNNSYHNYLFQFDLINPQYKFYKHLLKNNFNANSIKLSTDNDDKLTATFSLSLMTLNEELLKFIYHYLEYTSIDNAKPKANPNTNANESVNYKSLQAYLVYYTTIHKNILSITDKMPNQTIASYINTLTKDIENIAHHQSKINSMNNNTIQENFEHLYIYNQMHSLLNKKNIHIFNLENISLLFNHQYYLYEDIKKLQLDSIRKLKSKYIR